MKKKNNTIKINKYFVICIVLLLCLIIYRFIYVATAKKVDGVNLAAFASNRNTQKETLYATRGTIYDTTGEILAQNVNSYTVIAYLSDKRTEDKNNPQHVVDKQMTAEKLSPLINMSTEKILELLNKDAYQVELGPGGRGITELVKGEIEKLELPGIAFVSSSKRYYKMGDFASYTIGYAKADENGEINGEMGIEEYFNDILKGKDGYKEYQKDLNGYQMPNTPEIVNEPVSGKDIYLTLDNNIQILLENSIDQISQNYTSDWMSITIADAKTGAIVASASNPSFNLNTLENIQNYYSPLVSYAYEPGSTMKVFSFMSAIEVGLYNGSETYQSGTINIGDDKVVDFNGGVGWGQISYDTGFSYSSNTAATMLAQKLGRAKLREYYEKLGFGTPTGITLPGEMSGKIGFKYDIEVANAAFGQGILVTPIQMIQALTTVTNDGVMLKPYIVSKIVDSETGEIIEEGKRTEVATVFSKETTDKMKSMMHDVVYSGLTDAKYYQANNVSIMGKTGTAQIASPSGGYLTGEYDYIRSFAGIFPEEDPKYIIYIATKKFVGPIKEVANLVKSVVEEVAKYKNITQTENALDAPKIISLNNYINKDVNETVANLESLGLNPIIIGDGNKIINQYPLKSSVVVSGSKVFLLTSGINYTMPDVANYSRSDIINFCKMLNWQYTINGYGKVGSTSVAAGSPIDVTNPLTIELN